jgi:hypothetical protein
MELYVLFAQQKGRYKGQFGLEALACQTEYEREDILEYLEDAKKDNIDTGEFEAVEIVKLDVDEDAIHKVLFPEMGPPIVATVI